MKQSSGKTWKLYCRLLAYARPFWLILSLGIVANVVYSGIDALFTYLMRPFLDKGFVDIDIAFIKQIPMIILCGITIRGLVSSGGSYCMTWVARSIVKVLRQQVFAHMINLPAEYYDTATAGQLLSKILYDVEQVAQVSADALTDFIQNTCLVCGLLTVILIINWQLSLMFLSTVPFVGLIVNYTNKRVRRSSHKAQKSMSEITEIAAAVIDGYQVVRIFGGAKYEIEKFKLATQASRRHDLKVAVSKAINVFGVQFIIAVGIAAIILAAIKLAAVITVTAGAFLAIIAGMLQLIRPMKILTTLNATLQRGLAGAESVFTFLDQPTEVDSGSILTTKVRGEIEFYQVSYCYRATQTTQMVLRNLNFTIAAGETVAFVGHSGSGKTTITSLLARFYDIQQGDIRLDGESIYKIALGSLRAQIAVVSQNVTLFNDTVANNIAYGCFNATNEQIIYAAKLAYADEFIDRLPQGYATMIGDKGVLLSGGQRQRLAIARAILKDAPILILDEATSALDSESERYIQLALEQITRDRTTLIIAHRLSTIQRAKRIMVIHHGSIVEQGSHQQLLLLDGHYAQLFRAQKLGVADVALPL